MTKIIRNNPKPRLSDSVEYGNLVYFSGQVPNDIEGDITAQTKDLLNKIDALLAQANSDKFHILTAQIWLKNISRDFADFNQVWEAWLAPEFSPARATVEANMARENCLVEIMITAVKKA